MNGGSTAMPSIVRAGSITVLFPEIDTLRAIAIGFYQAIVASRYSIIADLAAR